MMIIENTPQRLELRSGSTTLTIDKEAGQDQDEAQDAVVAAGADRKTP